MASSDLVLNAQIEPSKIGVESIIDSPILILLNLILYGSGWLWTCLVSHNVYSFVDKIIHYFSNGVFEDTVCHHYEKNQFYFVMQN